MLRAMIITAILCGVAISNVNAIELPFYRALADIESGGDKRAKGSKGERTAFQIRPGTWKEFTGLNFTPKYYHDKKVLTKFFVKYNLNMNERFMRDQGRRMSPGEYYAIWNMGYEGFKKRGFNILACPRSVQDRVMRFYNLLHLYESVN